MAKLTALLTPFLLALAACTHSGSAPEQHGGQDGGGGHVARSTPDQVRKAIEVGLALWTDKDPIRGVPVKFAEAVYIGQAPKFERIFPQDFITHRGNRYARERVKEFSSPYLQALDSNRLILKETGDCGSAKDNHADGSVSKFDLGADICLSISNLTRLSPDILMREVLALMLHEAAHMAGADEPEAQLWQSTFRDFYMSRYGDLVSGQGVPITLIKLEEARQTLARAIEWDKKHPSDPRLYSVIGKFEQILQDLPDVGDRLRLQITYAPMRPWLAANYMDAVTLLRQNASRDFSIDINKYFDRDETPAEFPKGKQRTESLERMAKSFRSVRVIFAAYSGRKDSLQDITPEELEPYLGQEKP